ncbi:MAG: hypothetical protein FWE31_04440 [Firmicutes bacterium]|nr:hypothetical protein [Bacillota bacterium]
MTLVTWAGLPVEDDPINPDAYDGGVTFKYNPDEDAFSEDRNVVDIYQDSLGDFTQPSNFE